VSTSSSERNVLVTGGAGFIGSHLCETLLARGDRVTVVDDLSTGRLSNLASAKRSAGGRLEVIEARVAEALPNLRNRRYAEIYHLAAAVGVRLVVEEPVRTIETNVMEGAAVLEYASRQRTRILMASTSEVYGKGAQTPFSEEDDLVYGASTVARWCYGISKAVDEHLSLAHHRRDGLAVVIARFFNTVGPRQTGQYGMVLPRFVQAALAGEPIEVHGDGLQARCFCDVRDVAPALPTMLESQACTGRVFNVGSDRPITILELAQRVKTLLESRSEIRHVPYAEAYGGGFEDLRVRLPNLARIRSAIEFAPRFTLDQTIQDVAASLRAAQVEGAA